jgi:hypothetical protein
MPRGNGGIVGPVNTSFSGVWSLTEAQLRRGGGTWPSVYQQAINELSTGSDAVVYGSAADPYFEYTTLLLPGNGTNGAQNNTFLDGSTNNFTITRNGNTTQGTFSPFSQTGWGNYFSANTSELSFASNAAFNLSGVSWTIEFWVYPTENAPARQRNWITRRQASGGFTSSYQIYSDTSSNALKFLVTGQTVVTSTSTITANQWNHVAVVWNGTALRFFINGNQDATTGTYGAGSGGDAEPLRIGRLATNDNVLSYMSNVRVVKGVAVYIGNFTVPSTPLAITQSSGTNISAITGTQTSLLTCQSNRFVDVTANAFVPTVGTGTSVQAFSPFNPTASWSAATYGGSGYFDGSTDYLNVTSPTFTLGTSNLTAECWFYPTAAGNSSTILACKISGGAGFYFVWASTTNAFRLLVNAGAVWSVDASTSALNLNSWNHLVMTRDGTTIRTFLNGVLATVSTGISGSMGATAPIVKVGADDAGSGVVNACYITNTRIIVGSVFSAYQTSSTTTGTQIFTPPTAPLTNATDTKLLLNFTNGGIYDATSKNDLETVGSAQISTTQSQFGGSSIYLNGSGSYLKAPPTQNIAIGTVFTVECWVYLTSWGAGSPHIFDVRTSNIVGAMYLVSSDGTARFQTTGTGVIASKSGVTLNAWTHIAFVSDATSSRVYVNGSNTGGTNQGQAQWPTTPPGYAWIGANFSAGDVIYGYIQDFRVTKYARYTSNFTPPTAAFPTL